MGQIDLPSGEGFAPSLKPQNLQNWVVLVEKRRSSLRGLPPPNHSWEDPAPGLPPSKLPMVGSGSGSPPTGGLGAGRPS